MWLRSQEKVTSSYLKSTEFAIDYWNQTCDFWNQYTSIHHSHQIPVGLHKLASKITIWVLILNSPDHVKRSNI
jgi:hypothetical protein